MIKTFEFNCQRVVLLFRSRNNIVPIQETQEELEQQIEEQMKSLRMIRVDWLTYQGGI